MKQPITRARPRPVPEPADPRPWVLALARYVLPIYGRLVLRIASVDFIGGEHFVEAVRGFHEGRGRLMLALRHPYGDEPQLMTMVMRSCLDREARRLGARGPLRSHSQFLAGYEVALWSDALVRWLMPRVGALPVYHVRMAGASLRAIRAAFVGGKYPLAIAPEGQVSYRSETLPRLEKGVSQFGFWCAEDLAAAGRDGKVWLLPLSVHVRYREKDLVLVEKLAGKLEARLGMPVVPRIGAGKLAAADVVTRRRALGLRLRSIDLAILGLAESYYGIPAPPVASEAHADFVAWRETRRQAVLEAALRKGEATFGLPSEGDSISRVYRIRHEGWNRIYPERDLSSLAPLERELADRAAGEAWYAMRHMEFVDLGFYLDAAYLEEGLADSDSAPSLGRLVETAYNLADWTTRLTGGDISDRPNILRRAVTIVARPPLELGSRLPEYKTDRRAALDAANADLARAFTDAIKEYLDANN